MVDSDIDRLTRLLKEFAQERDWEQFHTPKNLVMALSVEVAELVEHFQWLTPEQSVELSPEKLEEVSEEIADTFNYLLRLCDQLDVDLVDVAENKIASNRLKYPAEKVRGNAAKYTDYEK